MFEVSKALKSWRKLQLSSFFFFFSLYFFLPSYSWKVFLCLFILENFTQRKPNKRLKMFCLCMHHASIFSCLILVFRQYSLYFFSTSHSRKNALDFNYSISQTVKNHCEVKVQILFKTLDQTKLDQIRLDQTRIKQNTSVVRDLQRSSTPTAQPLQG